MTSRCLARPSDIPLSNTTLITSYRYLTRLYDIPLSNTVVWHPAVEHDLTTSGCLARPHHIRLSGTTLRNPVVCRIIPLFDTTFRHPAVWIGFATSRYLLQHGATLVSTFLFLLCVSLWTWSLCYFPFSMEAAAVKMRLSHVSSSPRVRWFVAWGLGEKPLFHAILMTRQTFTLAASGQAHTNVLSATLSMSVGFLREMAARESMLIAKYNADGISPESVRLTAVTMLAGWNWC